MNNPETLLFVVALACYLLAFTFYSIYMSFNKRKLYGYARILNWAGVLFAFLSLGLRWKASGHPPLTNMYESLATLSTFVVLASLKFTSKEPITSLEAGADACAIFMIGVASVFPANIRPLIPALQSYWLHLHVTLAFLGEACFAIAFILSYLYCFKRLRDENSQTLGFKEKLTCHLIVGGGPILFFLGMVGIIIYLKNQPNASNGWLHLSILTAVLAIMAIFSQKSLNKKVSEFLPSAERLDDLTYKVIALGYPLFTVGGLIFGMIWANKAWGRYWGWDPKETWALITFFVYSIYLHVRLVRGWSGVATATLSIVGFLATLFTLFGVNLLIAGLHSYV
jgi:cytochrome c-type biogenesis protein CcsB